MAPKAGGRRIVADQTFSIEGFHGRVAEGFAGPTLAAEVVRLIDPSAATETLLWGRNYL
jgi:hypothetical protein